MSVERGKTIPIDSVWVDRATRQRREVSGVEELAASIARTGFLIHPITIRRSGELVAGERRLMACRSLGWTAIEVQFLEDLDELSLHLVELEENLARINLTWQDECAAIEKYHTLQKTADPSWTAAKTADALGVTEQSVGQKLLVAKELATGGNKLLAEADKFSTARNIATRASERRRAATIDQVFESSAPKEEKPAVPLLNEDFNDWLARYSDPLRFNLIHCDFPYGVGMHRSDQGSGKEFDTYIDTRDVYFALLDSLAHGMDRVVAPSAHLIFWFSMDYYGDTVDRLTKMGWRVNPFPLIWHKSDNIGILPDANRGPRRIYETALFASRGDRLIVRAVSNVVSFPGRDKEIHMNEKPVEMLSKFLEMVCDENSFVLDPTAGSANALKAAQRLGAAKVLGLERDPEFYRRAVEAWG